MESTRLSPQEVGRLGEHIARQYLQTLGYTIVATNWRPKGALIRGELDVVALHYDTLVFVEVKTRSTCIAGEPFEAITPAKMRALRRLAHAFLSEKDRKYHNLRFDAVGIELSSATRDMPRIKKLQHLRGVR